MPLGNAHKIQTCWLPTKRNSAFPVVAVGFNGVFQHQVAQQTNYTVSKRWALGKAISYNGYLARGGVGCHGNIDIVS